MKRILFFAIVCILLLSLTACTKAEPVSATDVNEALQSAMVNELNEAYLQTQLREPVEIDVVLTDVTKEETQYVVKGMADSVFQFGDHTFPKRDSFTAVCRLDEATGEYAAEDVELKPESTSAIEFPGLGVAVDPSRSLPFTIFGKQIYYYGLIIAIGFVLAIFYGKLRCRDFGVSFDSVTDAILFAVPAAIICARIYYVVFSWDYYKTHLNEIYRIWEGGIAIYGGVIGAALGLILFSKVRKKKLSPYLDIMGLGLLIGQLIGRWGNFFNREAHGAETGGNFFLRMYMYSDQDRRWGNWHPTFLYESVWNLAGFLLLHFLSKKRKFDGQVFLMYVAWYGLGRVWIEGLRTDSLWIGPLRVSQLLAGLSFFAAMGIIAWILIKKKPDGRGMLVHQLVEESEPTDPEPEQS